MLVEWRVNGDGRSWNSAAKESAQRQLSFLGDYRKCSTAGTKVPSYSVFETVYPIMKWI